LPSSIARLHQEYAPRGLAVLAIDIEEDDARVRAFAERVGLRMPVLLDRDGAVTGRYGVTATPTVFLVARDGALVGKALGTKPWLSPAGRALLEALLAR
jgi:peroxiredoxin